MIEFVLAVIFVLWLLGFVQVDLLSQILFSFNGQTIDIKDVLIFLLIVWLIGLLPRPFREIVAVLFVLWLLSLFGIVAIAGLTDIIIFAVVVGAIVYLLKR